MFYRLQNLYYRSHLYDIIDHIYMIYKDILSLKVSPRWQQEEELGTL